MAATKGTTPATEKEDDLGEGESAIGTKLGNMLAGGGSNGVMANLKGLDLSKASSSFKLLPENVDYIFNIRGVKAAKSGAGNAQLILTLEEDDSKTKVNDYVVYGGDNPWKFKSLCHATGYLSEDGSTFTGENERDFLNKQIKARVQHDTYQGEKRNKIKGGYKPVDPDDANYAATAAEEPNFGD